MEVLVLFNYDGQADDELTIRKGDVILDVKKLEGGWWEGLLGSKRGLFPDNFVMVVAEADMNQSYSSAAVRSEKGRKCRALFSYAPSHEDELQLLVGDEIHFLGEVEEGWWRGKLNGKIGVFPSNFVVIEDPPTSTAIHVPKGPVTNQVAISSDIAPELPPKPLREIARVLFPYSALQPDELELREGDLVTIHSKDCEDKGWWKGEVNNKIGVFPDNFVEVIPHNSSSGALGKSVHPTLNISPSTGTAKTPQIRGVPKKEPASPPPSTNIDSVPRNISSFTGNTVENPNSLSDEQKLQQVADILNAITPTESLPHITASRARPTKTRRPPSALFFKDVENEDSSGGLSIPSVIRGLSVPTEELEKSSPGSPVEQQQRPMTKMRNSSIKPPWMEELKRNQEKKEKGSITTTTNSNHEKPSVLPVKPIIPKSTNTSTDVPPNSQPHTQSEANSVTLKELISHKVGPKNVNAKFEQLSSVEVPGIHEGPPPKSFGNVTGPISLSSVLPNEKTTQKESAVPSALQFRDEKKTLPETGTSMVLKEYPEANFSSHGTGNATKQTLTSLHPSKGPGVKQTVCSTNHNPVNLNELAQLNNSDYIVQRELHSLQLRVASLEATVLNLQMELLQLKNAPVEEHKCRCMQKVISTEASLVHI